MKIKSVIAEQCPYEGGRAVYRARFFISLFDDAKVYDDDKICHDNGYERIAKNESIKTLDFIIKPNPASEQFQVIIPNHSNEVIEVELTSLIGATVFRSEKINANTITLNAQNYPSGVLNVKVLSNGVLIGVKKLVVIK